MKLIAVYCTPEQVDRVVELGESLGAEGGEMVPDVVRGTQIPEFTVPDPKTRVFVEGCHKLGFTMLRLSNPPNPTD